MASSDAVHELYSEAAKNPKKNLCCAPKQRLHAPGLHIPREMLEMDYGCGSTVHPPDLQPGMDILYIGVGGGLEALTFAYITRRPGSVIAVDSVPAMLEQARENLESAARLNDWFRPEFVKLVAGSALQLPVPDNSVDLVAQNCLFNIFKGRELDLALAEVNRVLRPRGLASMSDPITPIALPPGLMNDEQLRAWCLSGALPLEEYLRRITQAGFGTVEIRARRPFRVLDPVRYQVQANILLEDVDLVAYKVPVPDDGPCVFTGRTAIYVGIDEVFDDNNGHRIQRDIPLPVCDKTAARLKNLGRKDLIVTDSTWHFSGDGCC